MASDTDPAGDAAHLGAGLEGAGVAEPESGAGPDAETGSPAAASTEPASTGSSLADALGYPAAGVGAPGASPRPQPADSALAALDSGLIRSADPSTGALAAAVVAASTVRPGPHPGSALPGPDESAPSADFPVKAHEGSRCYYTLESPFYHRTRADLWFRTAEDAHRAGFRAWDAWR